MRLNQSPSLRSAPAARAPLWRVVLASIGNPDHDQDGTKPLPGVPRDVRLVRSYAEASAACREYIARYRLGAGNWHGGDILDVAGKVMARVSYNGRVWPPEAWFPEQQPLYRP